MTLFIVAAVLALLLTVVALTSAVRHDGYGTRPAPSSHREWDAGMLSSTPPASVRR